MNSVRFFKFNKKPVFVLRCEHLLKVTKAATIVFVAAFGHSSEWCDSVHYALNLDQFGTPLLSPNVIVIIDVYHPILQ